MMGRGRHAGGGAHVGLYLRAVSFRIGAIVSLAGAIVLLTIAGSKFSCNSLMPNCQGAAVSGCVYWGMTRECDDTG